MRLAEEAVCEEICLCKEICLSAKRSVINLEGNGLDAEAAKALGPAISASMSLTSVNLSLILELRQFNVQHRRRHRCALKRAWYQSQEEEVSHHRPGGYQPA